MIHVVVLGAGAICDSHIEAYGEHPGRCKVVAVVDRRIEAAKSCIERHQLDAVALDDIQRVFDLPQVDLVSICLPPALHCSVSVALLERGIHVLCEKPLAISVEECDKMIAAGNRGGAMLSTVSQNRFKPDVQKVKKLCESGIIGRLRSIMVHSLWWRGLNYYQLAWRGTWESEGGGCMTSHGIHHIDLMLWLMGEVDSVTAMVSNIMHTNSEVEDISLSMIRFKNGAIGNMLTSLNHHREEQRVIVDAEYGSVELPLVLGAYEQLENGFSRENEQKLREMQAFVDAIEVFNTGHAAQIDDMLGAIEQGRPPMVTGEDGRRSLEFIAASYQSAFQNRTVQLPITAADLFYTSAGVTAGATKFYEKTESIDAFANNEIQVGGTL